MEVSFIYVHEYKNILKQSFNLDGRYIFSFDITKGILSYKTNPKYIPDYFNQKESKSKIVNVTAVIGQNGAGKSTLLEFLGLAFRSWHNFGPAYSFVNDIIVTRVDQKITVLYGQSEYSFKLDKEANSWSLKPKSLIELPTDYDTFPRTEQNNQHLKKIFLPIYYSTSMVDRFHENGANEWDLINISNAYNFYATNVPVLNDRFRDTKYRRIKHPGNFKFEDSLRQITFLADNEKHKYLPKLFKTYPYFSISIKQQHSHEDTFKELFLIIYKKFKPINDIEFLRLQFLVAITHGLVYTKNDRVPQDSKESYLEEFNNSINNHGNLKEAILHFLVNHPFRDIMEMVEMFGIQMQMHDFRIREKEVLVKYLFESFTNENFKELSDAALTNFNKNLTRSELKVQNIFFNPFRYDIKFEHGKDLCELYLNQLEDLTPDFIEVHFDLSSGESAFLNLFSRFHYAYLNHKALLRFNDTDITKKYDTVLVMIDEAEAFFHPQWQKEYLQLFTTYFKNVLDGISVQIIDASNSPFITADLPSYNVIYLKPNQEGLCKVSPTQDHKNTLGANIYQLFFDAFYLQDGFTGNFAEDRIQEILEVLNYTPEKFKQLSKERKYYIKQLILNLGEPALKKRLEEMQLEIEAGK